MARESFSANADALARRVVDGAGRFASDAGLTRTAPVEFGSKVLDVDAARIASVARRVSVGSALVGTGAWLGDTVLSTSAGVGLGEVASAGFLGGVGASLVAAAPATPAHANNPLRLRSQKLRRAMIGSAATVGAANWLAVAGGVGGHHAVIGTAAVVAGAAGYLGGL